MESIISALIAGGLALLGVIITNMSSNRKVEIQLDKAQAITEIKLDRLTAEVKKHNDLVTKMPVIEEQIKTINHEIHELKEKVEKAG